MENSIFRFLTGFILLLFIAHRGYYSNKLKPLGETISYKPDQLENPLVNFLAVIALLITLVYLIKPAWLSWSVIGLPVWARWIGVAITLKGFGLLQWSQFTLGKNWSDEPVILEDQVLITSGPYRYIQHPIYTAFLMILGSSLLISDNWFLGLMWIGMVGIDIATRIRTEEKLLESKFGDQFQVYRSQTGLLIPRIFNIIGRN
jgi:protein-S-isoprenylcysteine O-methyltransferase Ste14